MSTEIKSLIEQRARAWDQAKSYLDLANSRGLETMTKEERAKYDELLLTAEERQSYDRANGEIDSIEARIEAAEKRAERAARGDELAARYSGDAPTKPADDAFATQMRAFLNGQTRYIDLPAPQGGRDSFAGIAEASRQSRALGSGTLAAGGAGIGQTYGQLIEHMIETASILDGGNVTTLVTGSGEPILYPRTSSFGAAATEIAEAGSITGTDPAFASSRLTIGAYKHGQVVDIPRELIDDNYIDIVGLVLKWTGRNLGLTLGARTINGSGSSQQRGLLLDTTLGVTGGTGVTGAPSLDDLISLKYSVIEPYAANGKWVMRRATQGYIRKLKDTTNNYLWQPSLVVGQPSAFDGDPIVTDINMPAIGLNAKSVVYGDLSAYLLRVVAGARLERDDSIGFKSDMVSFKAVIRADGALTDITGACKHFVGGAS